ncbi:MAG: hypothetical protein ACJ0DI_06540 [bacterium]
MQDNHSNLEEKQGSEESFQIEEGLSANVLNNMMEETLIRDSDVDSNQNTKSNEIKLEISEINEEKLDQFRHQITNALEQFWKAEFSDKTSVKFLSQELLQYKDFQKNNDQPSCVSFLSLREFGTVWIFQIESDQALKLASIFRARRQELESRVELSGHLDGSLFFEIGPFIKDIFELIHRQIIKQSLQKKFQLRHMLRPAFHRDINDGEPLLFFQYREENQNKKGMMRFGIPVEFIRRLFVMRN